MNSFCILCLDDDPSMRQLIQHTLSPVGPVTCEASIQDGLGALEQKTFNLIIIDLELGEESGFDFITYLKTKEFNFIPHIIVLTASANEEDELRSHQLSVSEYIRKPINPRVFQAQVQKYANSYYQQKSAQKKSGPISLDPIKQHVTLAHQNKGTEDVLLTFKEYQLLVKFLDHPGKPLSREELFTEVWDTHSPLNSRTIDMHVSALKKKLGSYGQHISSIRGVGYVFNPL